MKTLVTLLLTSLSIFAYAGIITVDNCVGSGADYTSIGAAVSAASNGDTIYIHPSSVSYGNVNVNKQLVLIGPGHYPEYTGGTGATLNEISLLTGSTGTVLTGLKITRIDCDIWQLVNDITISNNYLAGAGQISGAGGDGAGSNNWLIEGNVIIEEEGCGGCVVINLGGGGLGPSSNWIFRNNFIQTKASNSTHLFANLNSTAIIENNIIFHRNTQPIFQTSVSGAEFRNNIFWASNSGFSDFTLNANNVLFMNNITFHSNGTLVVLPGTDNIDNTDPEFVSAGTNPTWSYDKDYAISSTSPAHNAGTDGTDLGIYGANFPFRMEGYPQDFPRLQWFQVSNTVVPQGGTLEINLKAVRAGL
ncbi:MAG TPA: hypothetical protein P5514_06690 [Bacteroidales bacterium]|nr:hypothetical protein [Bacteroidales bacterium]HRX96616.1 hypothetical protein [Bacteroidales bacterium]